MLSIIVAASINNVIGRDNALPWHIPEDLRRFREITTGHAVIMGRKTFESIGKPLPNRTNIVLTRNADFRAEGVITVSTLKSAIKASGNDSETFIIGGSEVYKLALPFVERVYLTRIYDCIDGDSFFPALDSRWHRAECVMKKTEEGMAYSFNRFERV